MRTRLLLLSGVLSVGVAIPCAAQRGCDDCNATFTLNSSYTNGGTIDGTLTINDLTDTFTGADLTVSGFPSYQDLTLDAVGQQGEVAGVYGVNIFSSGTGSEGDLFLALPTSTLAGYDGSAIAYPTDVAFNTDPLLYFGESGTVAPVSPTPEPGSWMLLGTGLVGLMGLGWRRFV